MADKLGEGKALVAGPLKKLFFCGFPNAHTVDIPKYFGPYLLASLGEDATLFLKMEIINYTVKYS